METMRYKALVQLIAAMGSSLEMEKVQTLATEAVCEAVGCQEGFFYLWNDRMQRLVLNATTRGHERWIRMFELKLGEGMVGWCALHRQLVTVESNAVTDPRFRRVPGLDDDPSESFLAIPVCGTSGDLVGAFGLQGRGVMRFPPDSVEFAQHVGTLVAGMIEKSRLYSAMQRQLSVMNAVADLTRTVSENESMEAVLEAVVQMTMDVIQTDASAIWLANPEGTALELREYSRTLSDTPIAAWEIPLTPEIQGWLASDAPKTGAIAQLPEAVRKSLLRRFTVWAGAMLPTDTGPGLVLCFRRKQFLFLDDELKVLTTIAHQGAIGVSRLSLVQQLHARNQTADFFDALMGGNYRSESVVAERATVLGMDLEKAHLVVAADCTGVGRVKAGKTSAQRQKSDVARLWHMVGRQLERAFPGSLSLARDEGFQALVPLDGQVSHVLAKLQELKADLETRFTVQLRIAVGNPCLRVPDYARGLAEAHEALRIGTSLMWDRSRIINFADLGLYRYLYNFWVQGGEVRDTQQELLLKLLVHDRRHNTELLATLEKYLECLGHSADTAAALFIHRNSLRNRLAKINRVLGVDVSNRELWFPLYLALKIVRMRELTERTIAAAAPFPAELEQRGKKSHGEAQR